LGQLVTISTVSTLNGNGRAANYTKHAQEEIEFV